MNVCLFILIFVYVYSTNIYSSENHDPLLSGEWKQEIIQEEAIIYNKLIQNSNKSKNFTYKRDFKGRRYKQKWNGEIEFSIDDTYKETFPKSDFFELHIQEAEALNQNGHYVEAIRLLKGMKLCFKLQKERTHQDVIHGERNVSKLFNDLVTQTKDKLEQIQDLTEPFGCYFSNNLYLASDTGGYLLQIPKEFKYVFPDVFHSSVNEDKYLKTKINFFYIDKDDKPRYKDEYKNVLFKYENRIFWKAKEQIKLLIGTTKHLTKIPIRQNDYYRIWDFKRGLFNSVKRNLYFSREYPKPNIFVSHYKQMNKNGNFTSYVSREYYRYQNNRGVAIFLIYPENFSDESLKYWQKIIVNIKIKDF